MSAPKKRVRRRTSALALIHALRMDLKEETALRERLGDLLRQVARALKGPPPPGTLWSFHDLPELAAKAARAAKRRSRK